MNDVHVLVVGGASLDTLDGADGLVAGGAGMYTAMSAWRSGAIVSLYAPRPNPMPAPLRPIADKVNWLGPSIPADQLARFEISYRGGKTTYVNAFFGAEHSLTDTDLPDDLSGFDYVHLVPLGDIAHQRRLLSACRSRGAPRISIGTAFDLINERPDDARAVLDEADIVFMNEEESRLLFGSLEATRSNPAQTIYVTFGAKGATVVQGRFHTSLSASAANAIDPTGAGDTFCGATLYGLAAGRHPVMAARHAMPLAAELTEHVGPHALLKDTGPPHPRRSERARVDEQQVDRIAGLIDTLEDFSPFPFTGPDLPPEDHPATIDYFFAATLQQFGFWSSANGHYGQPLIASLDGEKRKGSFYLFRAFLRWLDSDPERLTPAGQAALTRSDLRQVLRADDGSDPMPALDLHLTVARRYGRDMLALGKTPEQLLAQCNDTRSPLDTLLRELDHVGGYKEDPIRKKSVLLGIILQQRPEQFLHDCGGDAPPVVDYHIMRSCLRTGLVEIADESLADKLVQRRLLEPDEEWSVRLAAHEAIGQLVERSGKSMGAVDWFFFQGRKRCPELSAPLCSECAIDPVCAHRKELFQPVIRTSFY